MNLQSTNFRGSLQETIEQSNILIRLKEDAAG